MTLPFAPQGTANPVSSPTVPSLPIRDPVTDVVPKAEQWRAVAQDAIQVSPGSPHYPLAQARLAQAAQALHANALAVQQRQAIANASDTQALQPGAAGTAITHFGQQASFGFSDELAGLGSAQLALEAKPLDWLLGTHFGGDPIEAYHRAVQEHRAYLAVGADANPKAALGGDVAGVAAQLLYPVAAAKAVPGLGNLLVAGTRPTGSFMGHGLSTVASAAAQAATVGTEAGLNAAGHTDEGIGTRLRNAGIAAALAAPAALPFAIAGTLGIKVGRKALQMFREGQQAAEVIPAAAASEATAPAMSAAEERIRAALSKGGMKGDALDAAIARMRGTPGNPLYDASTAQQALTEAGAHPATATMTAARNAQQVPVGTSAAESGAQPTLPWASHSPDEAARAAFNLTQAAGGDAKAAALRAGGFARNLFQPPF